MAIDTAADGGELVAQGGEDFGDGELRLGLGPVGEDLDAGLLPQAGEAVGGFLADVDDDGFGAEAVADLGDGVSGGISEEGFDFHAS